MRSTAISAAKPASDFVTSAWYTKWLERDQLPDWLIRLGIRRLLRQRLREEDCGDTELQQARLMKLIGQLRASPIAIETRAANDQHYEVPPRFFELVLGRNLKYSSAYWPADVHDLNEAEESMLALTCQRAQLQDGQQILELGCGWGSLSLYMASRFPRSWVTAVSNSRPQKKFIDARAQQRGLSNLTIQTADMNSFEAPAQYDRVLSVEMFEHMRNYQALLAKVARWMKPDAMLFIHIFAHSRLAYPFEVRDASDWMAQYFFTGGIMPSDDLLLYFQDDVLLREHWRLRGTHYQKTSAAWLANMDAQRSEIMQLFSATYGVEQALRWWVYWRVFFMACVELWGYRNGEEWIVSHYLFARR